MLIELFSRINEPATPGATDFDHRISSKILEPVRKYPKVCRNYVVRALSVAIGLEEQYQGPRSQSIARNFDSCNVHLDDLSQPKRSVLIKAMKHFLAKGLLQL